MTAAYAISNLKFGGWYDTGGGGARAQDVVYITFPSGRQISAGSYDTVFHLGGNWISGEFNVFGYGGGSQANFTAGTSATVGLTTYQGTFPNFVAIAPTCTQSGTGFTGETNNLLLGTCSSGSTGLSFTELNCNVGYCFVAGQCTNNDPQHCGSGCSACTGVANGTPICGSGQCGIACNAGYCANNGQCTSNLSDPAHCGPSCISCATSANGVTACSAGQCELTCNSGYTLCGTQCVNELNDNHNCGSCGNVCSGTATCSNGACSCAPRRCPSGYTWDPALCMCTQ